eukprot:gene5306-5343_t
MTARGGPQPNRDYLACLGGGGALRAVRRRDLGAIVDGGDWVGAFASGYKLGDHPTGGSICGPDRSIDQTLAVGTIPVDPPNRIRVRAARHVRSRIRFALQAMPCRPAVCFTAAAACAAMPVTSAAAETGATCSSEFGFDYSGFDIENTAVADAAACCAYCDTNPRCLFWSLELDSPNDKLMCLQKTSNKGRSPNSNRISGSRTGGPPVPPSPPPGKPGHYFSCTSNLTGVGRLPWPMCNASLPLDVRLADLLSRATYQEKAMAITSDGEAIPRLGVPQMGSAEDTHGVGGGCGMPSSPDSTGCPTTFPAGPGLGATFDRALWTKIGATIGREARGLNNQRRAPPLLPRPRREPAE